MAQAGMPTAAYDAEKVFVSAIPFSSFICKIHSDESKQFQLPRDCRVMFV
jgi:hypothetical protein